MTVNHHLKFKIEPFFTIKLSFDNLPELIIPTLYFATQNTPIPGGYQDISTLVVLEVVTFRLRGSEGTSSPVVVLTGSYG